MIIIEQKRSPTFSHLEYGIIEIWNTAAAKWWPITLGPRNYNACDCFASTRIALAIKRMLCFLLRTTDGRFNNSSHTNPMSYMVKEIKTFGSLIERGQKPIHCTSYRMHVFQTYVATSHRHEEKPITLRNRCHEIVTSNYSLVQSNS